MITVGSIIVLMIILAIAVVCLWLLADDLFDDAQPAFVSCLILIVVATVIMGIDFIPGARQAEHDHATVKHDKVTICQLKGGYYDKDRHACLAAKPVEVK